MNEDGLHTFKIENAPDSYYEELKGLVKQMGQVLTPVFEGKHPTHILNSILNLQVSAIIRFIKKDTLVKTAEFTAKTLIENVTCLAEKNGWEQS